MEAKIAARAAQLIPKAMAGDPVSIALLAMAGISILYKAITDKK